MSTDYRGSLISIVSTSTNSTSINDIGINFALVDFVLLEFNLCAAQQVYILQSTIFSSSQKLYYGTHYIYF